MELKDVKAVKQFNDEMFNKTMYYQKIYGFEYNRQDKKHAAWNNEADAFKHAYMQAIGSLRYSNPVAQFMGYYHEQDGNKNQGQPAGEQNMDTWNNRVGREIADEVRKIKNNFGSKLTDKQIEDIVAAKIMERMKKGDLITHPSDKRNYKDYTKYIRSDKSTGYAANIKNNEIILDKFHIRENTLDSYDPRYRTYINNIIFADEDISKLTSREFSEIEHIINNHLENNRFLSKQEAENLVQSGDLIWVNEYLRDDGTKVKGHYRTKAS